MDVAQVRPQVFLLCVGFVLGECKFQLDMKKSCCILQISTLGVVLEKCCSTRDDFELRASLEASSVELDFSSPYKCVTLAFHFFVNSKPVSCQFSCCLGFHYVFS